MHRGSPAFQTDSLSLTSVRGRKASLRNVKGVMPDRPQSVFLDTNIVLRATVPTSADFRRIRAVLDTLIQNGAELWISRQVLREYAMNVTRAQVFLTPVSHETAAALIRQLTEVFHVADETQAVSTQWVRLLETIPMGGKQVHDANIAATMIVYDIPALLTLNTVDFMRFQPHIRVMSLDDVEAL